MGTQSIIKQRCRCCLFLPWQLLPLPLLKPRRSPATATATELAMVAHMEELATVSHTEDMVATMARERLNPQLLPKLKPILTTALTAMVDTDCLTEATDVHTEDTAFLTVAAMVATDSLTEATAAATMARGKLTLLLKLTPPSVRTARGGLLTDVAMGTATEATATPPEATADPIQSPVATDPTAAMALLTAATTTERRQH